MGYITKQDSNKNLTDMRVNHSVMACVVWRWRLFVQEEAGWKRSWEEEKNQAHRLSVQVERNCEMLVTQSIQLFVTPWTV